MTDRHHAFDPQGVDDLPSVIPVFPLAGALLLPRAELPLNIFEPRYLTMVADSLKVDRMFGMVQPSMAAAATASAIASAQDKPPVYDTGCLGRMTAFQETDDGRLLISLRGLCRFTVARELEVTTPYRQVQVDYTAFAADFTAGSASVTCRDVLLPMLRNYFDRQRMEVDWACIEQAPMERLVNYLAMICPFDTCEKQVLLEAPTVAERSRLLMGFLQLPSVDGPGGGSARMQ